MLPSYAPPYSPTPLPPPPPPPPYYPSYYYHYFSYTPPTFTARRSSTGARFTKALIIALVLYFVLLKVGHTVFEMAHGRTYWDDGAVGAPWAEDGDVIQSIDSLNWTSYHSNPWWQLPYPHSAETSFTLPVDSEELYLISRGSYQHGKVEVKQASGVLQGSVKVDVRVAYYGDEALARATVCRLQKDGRKDGVGIFTPTRMWSSTTRLDQLYIEVAFTFPVSRSPLHVKGFSTSTSNFVHDVGDLWQTMVFDNVDLKTSNSHIDIGSITLANGMFKSSNSHIRGHFNTSDSLTLHTSNGYIEASASLLSARERPTKLDMKTSNSQITSTQCKLSLEYDDAPMNARLSSKAKTSNAQASVKMHPAFEGTFELKTSNASPVVRDVRPSDPSGRGRRRTLNQYKNKNTISGTVHWVDSNGRRGEMKSSSTVTTSNAQVDFEL
ncbi:hypothetical protein BU15DRAFT_76369 [Melanogaster broomeanus]|nr:hypothetical protein BU15DRAFT_76369 [Melanogaster broomeanus]